MHGTYWIVEPICDLMYFADECIAVREHDGDFPRNYRAQALRLGR